MATKSKKDAAWIPVHRGEVYCSPACGAGCRYDAYQEAERRAAALVKALGANWSPRVWENLGWHWEATHNKVKAEVTEAKGVGNPTYTAWIQTTPQFIVDGKTPKAAFSAALKALRAHLNSLKETEYQLRGD